LRPACSACRDDAAIDKLDGDRFRSRALPSTFATWRERRKLIKVLAQARPDSAKRAQRGQSESGLLFFRPAAHCSGCAKLFA